MSALQDFWRWRRRDTVLAIGALTLVALFPLAISNPLDAKLDFAIYAVAWRAFVRLQRVDHDGLTSPR